MAEKITLTQTRIRAGVWEGVLAGVSQPPHLDVVLQDQPVTGVKVAAIPGRGGEWQLRVPIPAQELSEGVQTFLIRLNGEVLNHFTVITGLAVEDDLRAEIDLLRAELDLLKRAFRRHCLETAP